MKRPPATSQPQDKYIVRFPEGMRERIAAEAKLSGRSMNAEIVARLQNSFEWQDVGKAQQEFKDLVDKLGEDKAFYARLGESFVDHMKELAKADAATARAWKELQKSKKR